MRNDVRISADSDPVAMILSSKSGPADASEALIRLATERMNAGDLPGARTAAEAAVKAIADAQGADAPAVARPLAALGRVRLEAGEYEPALADFRRAWALLERAPTPDPAEAATLIYDQARVFDAMGRNEEAEAAARDSLARRQALFGDVHEKTADSANLVANALTAQGRHAEADPFYRQVLGMYEVLYGPDDFHVAIVLSNLANSLRRTGRAYQAEPLYVRAVAIAQQANDPVLLAQCLTNYGWFLHITGQGEKAEAPFRQALDLAFQIVGPNHPFTGVARANLGYALADQQKWAEAEAPFREGLATLEAGIGADSPDLLETLDGYALVMARLGKDAEAEALYQRAAAIAGSRLPPAHADSLATTEHYAAFLVARDRPGEALVRVRAGLNELLGQDVRGRDWRNRVRGAGPLFGRQVEAAWAVSAATD